MHQAFTTTSKNFFNSSSDDLLSPISLTNRSNSTLSWSQSPTRHLEADSDNWNLPSSKQTTATTRRGPLPKLAFPSIMPSRTTQENHSSKADLSAGRWRFNGTGQLVDSEAATTEWDLADEIVNLKIGADDGTIRTPPQKKIPGTAIVQLAEGSPLETSSDTSIDSSEHPSDHQINISHSRGSSTDTTISSSHESVASHTLRGHPPLKVNTGEAKERPHSFSGGLSSADLRRLQQAGEPSTAVQPGEWTSSHYRDSISSDKQYPTDQPTYPSLTSQAHIRPQQPYDYRSAPNSGPSADDLQVDYNIQQRAFNGVSQGQAQAAGPPMLPFVAGRISNPMPNVQYRQPARGFGPQGVMPSPTNMGYPGHASHLSLGNTQQLYEMMLPPHPETHHPAVTRVQQQHNVFRAGHQHSASDPSAIRDVATLALLNNNMQAFGPAGPGMFAPAMAPPPTMSMYANQFYAAQDAYPRGDVAVQAMARLQSPYTGQYAMVPQGIDITMSTPGLGPSSPTSNGPSANNRKLGLYKTELCRSWEEKGTCRYGAKCQFAHGEDELRKVARHPKYKTEICRTFWVSGSCPYGKRCCFIHTELPTSGAPPGAEGAPPPAQVDGRARSMSTNSDPNDQSISILARIAKRTQEISGGNTTNSSTPVDLNPPSNNFQLSRPPTGSLKVNTAVDPVMKQQNKSAYPTFTSNGLLMPSQEQTIKSPVPVTAGPDLGRHNNSRIEIVGYNQQQQQQQRLNKSTPTNPNLRHSFNGTEVNLNFNAANASSQSPSFAVSSTENSNPASAPRANGHTRSGSAGNWGSFSRSSHLAASPYPNASSPAGEMKNSPWATSELAVGSSRLNEKAWA